MYKICVKELQIAKLQSLGKVWCDGSSPTVHTRSFNSATGCFHLVVDTTHLPLPKCWRSRLAIPGVNLVR
jgi:hypothetical protein